MPQQMVRTFVSRDQLKIMLLYAGHNEYGIGGTVTFADGKSFTVKE